MRVAEKARVDAEEARLRKIEEDRLRLLAEEEARRLARERAAAEREANRLKHHDGSENWNREERLMANALQHMMNRNLCRAWDRWMELMDYWRYAKQIMLKIMHGSLLKYLKKWREAALQLAEEARLAEEERLRKLAEEEAERLRRLAEEEARRRKAEEDERARRAALAKEMANNAARRDDDAKAAAEAEMKRLLDAQERAREAAEEAERARLAALAEAKREAELAALREAAGLKMAGFLSDAAKRNAEVLSQMRIRWIKFMHAIITQGAVAIATGGDNLERVLQEWFSVISTQYKAPHRFLHNMARISEALALLDEHSWLMSKPQCVELAIWFHCSIWDTVGNVEDPGSDRDNAMMSSRLLGDFICAVDLALQQDATFVHSSECAVDTLFDEEHPLAEPNEKRMSRWIQESAGSLIIDYDGITMGDEDGEIFLDIITAVDYSVDSYNYELYSKRLAMEMSPPMPVEDAEEREITYARERESLLEESLAQQTIFRQDFLRDAYEVQAKANIFSELELMRFKNWSTSHSTNMLAHRSDVDARLAAKYGRAGR